MEELDTLIGEAEELKNVDYKSPRFHLWENRAKQFVQNNYGDEYLDILERSLDWGRIIMEGEGQEMHVEALQRAIEFLNALKNEPKMKINETSSNNISQSVASEKTANKFGSLTISGGNVFFGDGATLTQIYVKDVIDGIAKEIEESIPNSQDKQTVLEGLKQLTTNETFASVTGSFVGEVLKRLVHS